MKDESMNLSPAEENALYTMTALLQPTMTTDAVRDLLEMTEKGQVRNSVSNVEMQGWRYFDSPRRFGSIYGTQKGWERVPDVNGECQRGVKKFF